MRGTIHGKTIELENDPGLSEGQSVEVRFKPVVAEQHSTNGRKTAAGMLANDPEMDAYLDEIQRERKMPSNRELNE